VARHSPVHITGRRPMQPPKGAARNGTINGTISNSPLDQFEIGLALRLIVVPSRKGIAQGLLRFIVVACSRKAVGNEMIDGSLAALIGRYPYE
jgi:hypothetical protein